MSLHGASIIPNRNTLIEVSSYILKVSDNIRNWQSQWGSSNWENQYHRWNHCMWEGSREPGDRNLRGRYSGIQYIYVDMIYCIVNNLQGRLP